MMIVKTETGSVYEFDEGRVRRVEYTHGLRRDDEWVDCDIVYGPIVGESMVLALEPLSETADLTVRRTSRVIQIGGE
jgi:hypothetical protein